MSDTALALTQAQVAAQERLGRPLHELLHEWMYRKGWNQTMIGGKLGVSQKTVSLWVRQYESAGLLPRVGRRQGAGTRRQRRSVAVAS